MNSIKINFITNKDDFYNDYLDIVRAFYPYIILDNNSEPLELKLLEKDELEYTCIINDYKNPINNSKLDIKIEQNSNLLKKKSVLKRYSKVLLYDVLSKKTGRKLPYGSLTGIRPTKLYRQFEKDGVDAKSYFLNDLRVSKEKVNLINLICTNQEKYLNSYNNEIDLFVNIPICVSRCSYCTFLSAELSKIRKSVQPYCDLLVEDINRAKRLITDLNLKVRAIYIGGGTPTSLNVLQLNSILVNLADIPCKEFTVEAGRPDTITLDKLKVMQNNGVTRISINPQTFNQKTLDIIGRKHSVCDILKKYEMARKFDFDINMDLIAMLPNETLDDFKFSIDSTIKLEPENITVHTLAIKRGSNLKLENYNNTNANHLAEEMILYSQDQILKSGYQPYYMYKQKYVSGNLENIGYCKPNTECIYNIDIMEEILTILACGAGGMNKLIYEDELNGTTLLRLPNPKGLDVYLDRKDKIFDKRDLFFKSKLKKF